MSNQLIAEIGQFKILHIINKGAGPVQKRDFFEKKYSVENPDT